MISYAINKILSFRCNRKNVVVITPSSEMRANLLLLLVVILSVHDIGFSLEFVFNYNFTFQAPISIWLKIRTVFIILIFSTREYYNKNIDENNFTIT